MPQVLEGHTEDVLDLSWSRGRLLLSASVDQTVKLWHISPLREGQTVSPVASFAHGDFVTSVRASVLLPSHAPPLSLCASAALMFDLVPQYACRHA